MRRREWLSAIDLKSNLDRLDRTRPPAPLTSDQCRMDGVHGARTSATVLWLIGRRRSSVVSRGGRPSFVAYRPITSGGVFCPLFVAGCGIACGAPISRVISLRKQNGPAHQHRRWTTATHTDAYTPMSRPSDTAHIGGDGAAKEATKVDSATTLPE